MSVSGVSSNLAPLIQSVLNINQQLDTLQQQLGTGQKSDTYAGLGSQSGMTIALNAQLAALGSFDDTIANVGTTINLQQSVLQQIATVGSAVHTATMQPNFAIDGSGQTTDQKTAAAQLDQILSLLNTQGGNGYLFSGSAPNLSSVDTADHILNGNGAQAGLKQLISERNQADLGADGLGRLVIPAASTSPAMLAGTGATLTPDAPAVMTGTADIAPLVSAGGTLVINGTNVVIGAGANTAGILNTINGAGAGVTATLDANNQLVLTSVDAATAVDIGAGSTGSLLTELGLSVATANPTNLLTQGAVAGGQTLTFTVGGSPTLTVQFGNGVGQVATIAQLNAQLATLVGGTATANVYNGNITFTAGNTADTITVGGTATAANFGLAALVATPTVGTRVAVSEDVAGSPYGLKLSAVNSTLTGATVTGPAGSPAAISVDLGATNPNPGDGITYTFTLPDGTTQTLQLQATAATTPGLNQFTIGATPAATAANLQAALTAGVSQIGSTSLSAASAMAASNDFFDDPPLRVAGPPFDTATAQVAGTAANTVVWYTGATAPGSVRSGATARIDSTTVVSYGTQANEQGIRWIVQNIAALAATSYAANDPNASANYSALNERIYAALAIPAGVQNINDIEESLANAQTAMASAKSQHRQTSNILTTMLQSIEGVDTTEVGAKILSLQTSLSASLSTTARLSQINLLNYLAPVTG